MSIPQQPVVADAAAGAQGSRSKTPMVAAGAMVLVAGVVIAMGTRDAAPVPVADSALVRSSRNAPPPASAQPVSEETLAAYQTLDVKRAGIAAYNQGDFAGALSEFQAAVERSPEDADARNKLGQVLVRQGRAAEALPHFDAAVRLDEHEWSYRFNRARAYGLLNRWPDAVAEYRVAAGLFPDDHVTTYNLGLALMRVQQYREAATALEQAVASAPDEPDFLVSLGTAYVGAHEPGKARAAFEQFLERAPQSPDAPRVQDLLRAMAEAGQ